MVAKALLLVDLQNDFCQGGSLAVPEADKIMPLINSLMPCYKHIIASCDWHPAEHMSFADNHGAVVGDQIMINGHPQILWPTHCVQQSHGAAFHPGLNTNCIEKIIYKGTVPQIDSYSAFFDNQRLHATALFSYLKSQQIKHLAIVGLATDYCVKFTGLDALSLGFSVEVIADACRGVDLTPGDSERALNEMRIAGAKITTSETVLKSHQDVKHNDPLPI